MTETGSALYHSGPDGPAGPPRSTWFSTLRAVLEQTASADGGDQAGRTANGDGDGRRPAEPASGEPGGSTGAPPSAQAAGTSAAGAAAGLATRLAQLSPEAADVPRQLLVELLDRFAANITALVQAFHVRDDALLTALGRGWLPDGQGLDPMARAAQSSVSALGGVLSSGSVTVSRDGRSTTLIAAVTVAEPSGPVKLADPYWAQNDMYDVWLCAVHPRADRMDVARALLERILPQVGVLSAQLTPAVRDPRADDERMPRRLAVAIRRVVPTEDPEVVLGRLEGWRTAVEQLGDGLVKIEWEPV